MKDQAGTVTKVLSKEHHRIINQYFALRKDNEDKTEQIKDLELKLKQAEMSYAMKAPTMEFSYAIHEKSKIKLYDSLVPKIRSHAYEVGIFCQECKEKNRSANIIQLSSNLEELRL